MRPIVTVLALLFCSVAFGQSFTSDARVPTVAWEQTSAAINKLSVVQVASGGSGVYIGGGIVLTAKHVVERNSRAVIQYSKGSHAGTVTVSDYGDVAAIDLGTELTIPAVPVYAGDLQIGQTVYAAGYERGDRYRVFIGKIKSFGTYRGGKSATSGPAGAMGGNSGGPIFNEDGELVGIISVTAAGYKNSEYGNAGWVHCREIQTFLGLFRNKRSANL